MMYAERKSAAVAAAGLAAAFCLLLGSCSDSERVTDPPGREPRPGYPLATTENQLVANFEQAHVERKYMEYEYLLADDFQFWFAPEDADLPANGFFWERPTELASTERMLNGGLGQRPDGSPQPPVQNISLTLTPAEPAWSGAGGETVGGQTPVPEGAKKRRYNVVMRVTYAAGDIVSEVGGQELFYVLPTESTREGGVTVTEWKLLLWRDLGHVNKGLTESASWGAIKAVYGRTASISEQRRDS